MGNDVQVTRYVVYPSYERERPWSKLCVMFVRTFVLARSSSKPTFPQENQK